MESYAFVDPRGRLYPCMTLDMGSVFGEPFLAVWNGPRFRAFRREKRFPLCHRCPADVEAGPGGFAPGRVSSRSRVA